MSEEVRVAAKESLTNKEAYPQKVQKPEVLHFMDLPVEKIMFLQRTIGNQAVERLIRSGALQTKLRIGKLGDEYEQEADRVAGHIMRVPPNVTASIVSHQIFGKSVEPETHHEMKLSFRRNPFISPGAPQAIQRKPRQVKAHSFLGLNIGGGINPTLASRLDDVAAQLRLDYQASHGTPAASDTDVRNWAGINSIRGWRQSNSTSTSKHCSGSAVDVNYNNQPYIVTRSMVNGREVLGGELAGRRLTTQRQATANVFDRAKEFVFGRINIVVPIALPFISTSIPIPISLPNRADVSKRRTGESTGDVYDRFKETSNSLATYISLAFDTAPDTVSRQPINNIETASEAVLLRDIPITERKTEAAGIADIEAYIRSHLTTAGTGPTFHFSTGDVGRAHEFYFRMLRDYEHVRIPMVRGNPVARPANTRNPARGFLDMTREFVVAMADVGRLRWGISDLGAAESGDTHHFDLGNHGGVAADCLP